MSSLPSSFRSTASRDGLAALSPPVNLLLDSASTMSYGPYFMGDSSPPIPTAAAAVTLMAAAATGTPLASPQSGYNMGRGNYHGSYSADDFLVNRTFQPSLYSQRGGSGTLDLGGEREGEATPVSTPTAMAVNAGRVASPLPPAWSNSFSLATGAVSGPGYSVMDLPLSAATSINDCHLSRKASWNFSQRSSNPYEGSFGSFGGAEDNYMSASHAAADQPPPQPLRQGGQIEGQGLTLLSKGHHDTASYVSHQRNTMAPRLSGRPKCEYEYGEEEDEENVGPAFSPAKSGASNSVGSPVHSLPAENLGRGAAGCSPLFGLSEAEYNYERTTDIDRRETAAATAAVGEEKARRSVVQIDAPDATQPRETHASFLLHRSPSSPVAMPSFVLSNLPPRSQSTIICDGLAEKSPWSTYQSLGTTFTMSSSFQGSGKGIADTVLHSPVPPSEKSASRRGFRRRYPSVKQPSSSLSASFVGHGSETPFSNCGVPMEDQLVDAAPATTASFSATYSFSNLLLSKQRSGGQPAAASSAASQSSSSSLRNNTKRYTAGAVAGGGRHRWSGSTISGGAVQSSQSCPSIDSLSTGAASDASFFVRRPTSWSACSFRDVRLRHDDGGRRVDEAAI